MLFRSRAAGYLRQRYRPLQSPSAYSCSSYTFPTNFFSIPWEKTTMASFHDASWTSVVIRSRSARIFFFFYHHGRRCGRIIRKRQFQVLPCAPGHWQFFHVLRRTPCLCSRGRLQQLTRISYPCSRTAPRVNAQVVQDLDSRDLGMGSVKVLDQVGDPA